MSDDSRGVPENAQHYEQAVVFFEARDDDPVLWDDEYRGEIIVYPSGMVDCVEDNQLVPQHHVNCINYGDRV